MSIPYLLRPTLFDLHFHLTLWNSIGLRQIPKPTRFNTKRNTKSVPCTHTHVARCYCTPMQCNLCHCTQTLDQCMKTSTWTFYTVHYVRAMNTHVLCTQHFIYLVNHQHTFSHVNIPHIQISTSHKHALYLFYHSVHSCQHIIQACINIIPTIT